MNKLTKTLILALFITGCATTTSSSSSEASLNANGLDEGIVSYVVDGDTVVLQIDGSEETVRLIGIDTPESRPGNQPVQCFGQQASDFLTAYLPEGTIVQFARDVEARDRYDRLLLYLYKDGEFVNEVLVREGYANARSYAPNTSLQDTLDDALDSAKASDRGLWAVCESSEQPL